MAIEVTIRHLKMTAGIKEYAEARAMKLVEQFPRVENVHVVVDVQRHLYETEFIVQQKSVTAIGAKEHANTVRAAVDTAAARVEKQLRKKRKKLVSAHTRVAAAKK